LDYLEEASFVTTLLPLIARSKSVNDQLAGMADIAVRGCQEYLKMLMSAQAIHREYNRDDMQEFLTSVNLVLSLEHECDEALRQTQKTLFFESKNYKELQIYSELSRLIEESTNSLMTTVYIMHDHILEDMSR
jgi:negative regulator of genetic competence, sporulation and motility